MRLVAGYHLLSDVGLGEHREKYIDFFEDLEDLNKCEKRKKVENVEKVEKSLRLFYAGSEPPHHMRHVTRHASCIPTYRYIGSVYTLTRDNLPFPSSLTFHWHLPLPQ